MAPQDLEASHNEAAPLLEAPPASNRRRALGGLAALGLTIGACAVVRPSTLARSSTTALSKKYPHRIKDATECKDYDCDKAPLGQYCPSHVPGGGFSMRCEIKLRRGRHTRICFKNLAKSTARIVPFVINRSKSLVPSIFKHELVFYILVFYHIIISN